MTAASTRSAEKERNKATVFMKERIEFIAAPLVEKCDGKKRKIAYWNYVVFVLF
jgi:hypothetical protein